MINPNKATFLISAVSKEQYPLEHLPEVAFAGRSNVGKSSFINRLLNRKNLAHTGSRPGKTATLNFYNIDDALIFVDLPGYGYAEVSKAEKDKWGRMIEQYLFTRKELATTFLLVDMRHAPTADDRTMYEFIKSRQEGCVVIATKADKVKPSEREGQLCLISDTLKMDNADLLLPFSAQTGLGASEVWEVLYDIAKAGI